MLSWLYGSDQQLVSGIRLNPIDRYFQLMLSRQPGGSLVVDDAPLQSNDPQAQMLHEISRKMADLHQQLGEERVAHKVRVCLKALRLHSLTK